MFYVFLTKTSMVGCLRSIIKSEEASLTGQAQNEIENIGDALCILTDYSAQGLKDICATVSNLSLNVNELSPQDFYEGQRAFTQDYSEQQELSTELPEPGELLVTAVQSNELLSVMEGIDTDYPCFMLTRNLS